MKEKATTKKEMAMRRQTRSMTKGKGKSRAAIQLPKHAPFDWHTHGLIAEFKNSTRQDPWHRYEEAKRQKACPMLEKTDNDSCQTLGQLAQYAAELFNHQHRTHAFQLFIAGDTARLLYWDRAGAVVSESFSFVENSSTLARFFWRYQHMSAVRRGWDPSASDASKEEVAEFRASIQHFLARMNDPNSGQRRIAGAEKTLDENYPPYKMTVEAGMTGEDHEVIVQRPFETSRSPTGRATRAYLAYSLTHKRVVFLKDSWRVDILGLEGEGNIYRKLKNAEVPFIPDVRCAGDVYTEGIVQKTRAQKVARNAELPLKIVSSSSRKHMHHRVVQELAYSLSTSRNSKEYTVAFRDAYSSTSLCLLILQILICNRSD